MDPETTEIDLARVHPDLSTFCCEFRGVLPSYVRLRRDSARSASATASLARCSIHDQNTWARAPSSGAELLRLEVWVNPIYIYTYINIYTCVCVCVVVCVRVCLGLTRSLKLQ